MEGNQEAEVAPLRFNSRESNRAFLERVAERTPSFHMEVKGLLMIHQSQAHNLNNASRRQLPLHA